MAERVTLRVDGRAVPADAGISVAAALANSGVTALRASVTGEPRGTLCAMGICFECRVTIDGAPHRRACMEPVRDGQAIETSVSAIRGLPSPSATRLESSVLECEVAVIGAGPAGIAAACRAAESGARTILLDEGLGPGGQIHRHLPGTEPPEAARRWIARLARSGAVIVVGASVFDAAREGDAFRLSAETTKGACRLTSRRIVLATGARELFLPFPGWTLPGVLGAGGAQALLKSGASFAGRTAVVAGSGPLLLPVAASLAKSGAEVALVAEQAGLAAVARFGAGLARSPRRVLEAVRYRSGFIGTPYRTGTWIAEAKGLGRLESVVVTDGRKRYAVECDLAAVAYGLVPNTELARLLGCGLRGGAVAVDPRQQTSVPGVFCAGEPCGVAGVDVAVAEGEVAGLAAAGSDGAPDRTLDGVRASGRRLAARMDRAFAPRPELRALARPDTIVCRCEDTRLSALTRCATAREAKLTSRAGMGPCQGRVCGPGLEFLFGWDSDTVRPPAKPALIGHLSDSK
jgi:NADPH-dependent 2,4-dienoyl-CoA reductase/sulfur reductase-like enzyme